MYLYNTIIHRVFKFCFQYRTYETSLLRGARPTDRLRKHIFYTFRQLQLFNFYYITGIDITSIYTTYLPTK